MSTTSDFLGLEPALSPANRFARYVEAFIRVVPWSVAALALAVLLGWAIDSPVMKSVVPGAVAMNPTTAVAFLLAAATAWFTVHAGSRNIRRILAGGIIAIAALRLAAYIDVWDAGADRLLFSERLDRESIPNRMAPNTALAFFLIGISTIFIDSRAEAIRRGARALLFLVLLIAFVVLCGYAYSAERLVQVAGQIPMAVNTAAGLAVLAAALLCTRTKEGLVGEFLADQVGGRMARALIPAVVGVPLILGWVRVVGQRAGLYETEVGAALLVTAWIGLMTALLWWQAHSLNRADFERSRNEERITALNAEMHTRAGDLEAVNRELEAFSYSVSHDLRAPLRSITGFSQALLEDYRDQLDETGRGYLERVVRAGRRMAELIDDMLGLARVTRKELRLVPVDLSRIACGILSELREAAPERDVQVEIQPGIQTTGDPQLLRVALENLIGNAWKFTGNVSEPQIAFTTSDSVNGHEAERVYSVRDNGAGFDMQFTHKLFGVFQRLHTDAEFHGSGVGLATVQRIIHRHGGRVWAEGTVGGGATFYFTLLNTGGER